MSELGFKKINNLFDTIYRDIETTECMTPPMREYIFIPQGIYKKQVFETPVIIKGKAYEKMEQVSYAVYYDHDTMKNHILSMYSWNKNTINHAELRLICDNLISSYIVSNKLESVFGRPDFIVSGRNLNMDLVNLLYASMYLINHNIVFNNKVENYVKEVELMQKIIEDFDRIYIDYIIEQGITEHTTFVMSGINTICSILDEFLDFFVIPYRNIEIINILNTPIDKNITELLQYKSSLIKSLFFGLIDNPTKSYFDSLQDYFMQILLNNDEYINLINILLELDGLNKNIADYFDHNSEIELVLLDWIRIAIQYYRSREAYILEKFSSVIKDNYYIGKINSIEQTIEKLFDTSCGYIKLKYLSPGFSKTLHLVDKTRNNINMSKEAFVFYDSICKTLHPILEDNSSIYSRENYEENGDIYVIEKIELLSTIEFKFIVRDGVAELLHAVRIAPHYNLTGRYLKWDRR